MKHIVFFLCGRYLRRRKMMLLNITAVAVSCALLIIVASLFTGFINTLERSATQHLGDIVVQAPGNHVIADYSRFIDDLEKTAVIYSATGVLKNQGLLLIGPGKVRLARVWGVEIPRRLSVTPLQEHLIVQKDTPVVSMNPEDQEGLGGFVGIGVLTSPNEITDEYNMEQVKSFLGQRMALTTGKVTFPETGEDPEAGTSAPRFQRKVLRFTCTDVMHTGVWDLDEENVFVPIDALSELLHPEQEGPVADIIQIRLHPNVTEEVGLSVVHGIWDNFAGDLPWASYASIQTSRQMQQILIAEYRKQMGVLLLVFGLVSCSVILLVFCIFSLLVMTKRKDIAILKSCGGGSMQVAGMFLGFGFLNGILGAAVGTLLGCLITWKINPIENWISEVFGLKMWKAGTYMFDRIPNQVHWPAVGWVALAAVLAAMLGAVLPAIRAAWVDPVRILRYE